MAKNPEYIVSWPISANLDLFHFSKLISGMAELSRRGIVTVRLQMGRSPEVASGVIAWWDVRDTATQRTRRVAIDLADSGGFVDGRTVEHCDVYFKRSYDAAVIARFQNVSSRCVFLPFGLNHACLTRTGMPIFVGAAARRFAGHVCRARSVVQAFRGLYDALRTAGGLPSPQAFENDSSTDRTGTVVFQTRLWPAERASDALEQINLERAALVRALRAGVGDAFIGGVVADAFPAAEFQDVVVRENVHRSAYAELARRAIIGISSRGIHHSIPFKVSEYLAAGLCIVSTRFRYELPVPLVPGRHYLLYESADECVQAALWLLSHPDAAEQMRRENRSYYRTHVAPEAHVLDVLRRAFQRTPDPAAS